MGMLARCCYINVTRIQGFFEGTIPAIRYAPVSRGDGYIQDASLNEWKTTEVLLPEATWEAGRKPLF